MSSEDKPEMNPEQELQQMLDALRSKYAKESTSGNLSWKRVFFKYLPWFLFFFFVFFVGCVFAAPPQWLKNLIFSIFMRDVDL